MTCFGNSADVAAGLGQGQDSDALLSVRLSNITFAGNLAEEAANHFLQDAGETHLHNVLFGPSLHAGCEASSTPLITLLGGNMDSDGSCDVERTEPDPGLATSIAFDRGRTPTVALLPLRQRSIPAPTKAAPPPISAVRFARSTAMETTSRSATSAPMSAHR